MSECKKAEANLQEDVDDMILDYLTFAATQVLLGQLRGRLLQPRAREHHPTIHIDHPVLLADDFISINERLHATRKSSPESDFRIRLFQFMKDTERWVSVLERTFDAGQINRGTDHGRNAITFPFPEDEVTVARGRRRYQKSRASLLHLLPSFMALSASQLILQGNDAQITEVWMQLAADFMLHAALEHAIVFGAQKAEVTEKAFQWGFDWECSADEGTDEFMINAMFFDNETESTNEVWMYIRTQIENELEPPNGITFSEHAQVKFRASLLTAQFQENLLVFLENLHKGLPHPILSQAEHARIASNSDSSSHRSRAQRGRNVIGSTDLASQR